MLLNVENHLLVILGIQGHFPLDGNMFEMFCLGNILKCPCQPSHDSTSHQGSQLPCDDTYTFGRRRCTRPRSPLKQVSSSLGFRRAAPEEGHLALWVEGLPHSLQRNNAWSGGTKLTLKPVFSRPDWHTHHLPRAPVLKKELVREVNWSLSLSSVRAIEQ